MTDKFRSFRAVRQSFKFRIIYIPEKPLICTIKVAWINIAVSLDDELVGAVPAYAALLGLFTEAHSDEIVEISHADVVSAHEILDI